MPLEFSQNFPASLAAVLERQVCSGDPKGGAYRPRVATGLRPFANSLHIFDPDGDRAPFTAEMQIILPVILAIAARNLTTSGEWVERTDAEAATVLRSLGDDDDRHPLEAAERPNKPRQAHLSLNGELGLLGLN